MARSDHESPVIRLADVLALSRQPVKVNRDHDYPNLGIYSFGRGLFPKPPIDRRDDDLRRRFIACGSGQFVYSRLFAFEGAFGVVPPEMDGWYVSNEYPTFDVDESRALVEFLELAICRAPAWEELAGMTVGLGHRRQRLRPEDLLAFEIELPSLDEQRAIIELANAASQVVAAGRTEALAAFAALHAGVEHLLVPQFGWEALPAGWTLATLGASCRYPLGHYEGTEDRQRTTTRSLYPGRQRPERLPRPPRNQDCSRSAIVKQVRFALESGDVL